MQCSGVSRAVCAICASVSQGAPAALFVVACVVCVVCCNVGASRSVGATRRVQCTARLPGEMGRGSATVPIFVALALVLSVVVAFAALLVTVSAEDAALDDAALLKLKVRELKAMLAKKGPDAECVACTSKKEYVERIRETAEWPDAAVPEDLSDLDLGKIDGNREEEIEKLRQKLKDSGINAQMFMKGADGKFDEEAFAKQFKDLDLGKASDPVREEL